MSTPPLKHSIESEPRDATAFSHAISRPPETPIELVTEVLHGVSVTDPYRWLEDQSSARTRRWISEQTTYARTYLNNLPNRERIRDRVRELLAVETYDSLQKIGNRYFFRKRKPDQEQFCLYFQDGATGSEQLVIDPTECSGSPFVSARIRAISADGNLLAYQLAEGGSYEHTLHVFDLKRKEHTSDDLPRGLIRGFVFTPEGDGFLYVPNSPLSSQPARWEVYKHTFGTNQRNDVLVFSTENRRQVRIGLRASLTHLGIVQVTNSNGHGTTDFYLKRPNQLGFSHVVNEFRSNFAPFLIGDRIFALTNHEAPNGRIVEVAPNGSEQSTWREIVPQRDWTISGLAVANGQLFVAYLVNQRTIFRQFDFHGQFQHEISFSAFETVTLVSQFAHTDEILYECESFERPKSYYRYSPETGRHVSWREFRSSAQIKTAITHQILSFRSKDGTEIPLHLVGREDLQADSTRPAVLTAYGGFGLSMTPRFGVLTTFLIEHGCWFALAVIRGGSEFGREWHDAAKRMKRQTAYDDFVAAAEFLIANGYASPRQLAIFGGSNSGLLVGVAMTQRPELFRAVLCLAPLLDMLRYHHFDLAADWKEEFGSAENEEEFRVLRSYSPYHNVHPGVEYPAVMIVSGDADQNCNPMHARKMTALLQACNSSGNPILLDYRKFRGHVPALPLGERVESLTDRLSFLCHELCIDLKENNEDSSCS